MDNLISYLDEIKTIQDSLTGAGYVMKAKDAAEILDVLYNIEDRVVKRVNMGIMTIQESVDYLGLMNAKDTIEIIER